MLPAKALRRFLNKLGHHRFWIAVCSFLALPTLSRGQSPVQIVVQKVSGQCQGADVSVAQYQGEHYIKAFFNGSMFTSTDPGVRNLESKRCTLDLRLKIDPNHRFESFTFIVDGTYQISDKGTSRLTVSNTIGNAAAVRNTGFYSLAGGNPVQGELVAGGFAGTLFANQIDGIYSQCGSQIPVETSLFITVSQPSTDHSGMTLVDLDEAKSATTTLPTGACQGVYCLGKVVVKPCRP